MSFSKTVGTSKVFEEKINFKKKKLEKIKINKQSVGKLLDVKRIKRQVYKIGID